MELLCKEYKPVIIYSLLSILINWVSNLIVALLFPVFERTLNNLSFISFLVITTLNFGFLLCYLPETKNRSTLEVAGLFKSPSAWKRFIGFK